jgi:25S rRNA (adenine2142-N1)-methyltransferase
MAQRKRTKKPAKKLPLTVDKRSDVHFKSSSTETARLIRRFHVLNKELAKLKNGDDKHETEKKMQNIHSEMESMGGLDWYQRASKLGQSKVRGGDSSKWLMGALQRESIPERYKDQSMRLLDVGALSPFNYEKHKWIKATPIDLNPQHPLIHQQDFLQMSPPETEEERFDIVCLSLVVNFVGDPVDRGTSEISHYLEEIANRQTHHCSFPGNMLIHTRDFFPSQMADFKNQRLLYLVLPLPCITNSRYFSHDHLLAMMDSIGYSKCIDYHHSNKLAYYLFEMTSKVAQTPDWKKKILKDAKGRNNFSIVMSTGTS